MRAEEEFCRDVFTRFLAGHSGSEKIQWWPVPQAQEPPDYHLQVGNERFAVEVTSVMDSETVGNREYTSEGLNVALLRFCKSLESFARDEGALTGVHALTLEGISDLTSREELVRGGVLAYMNRTRNSETASEITLVQEGHNRITIQKVGNQSDCLEAVTLTGEAKYPGDIQRDLVQLITAALAEKAGKLSGIHEPKILLLLDRYHLGSGREWQEAAGDVSAFGFHTVARIWQDETTLVLHSETRDWASDAQNAT